MAFKTRIRTYGLDRAERRMADLSGVEHALAEKLRDVAEPYVPYHTGALAKSATVNGNRLAYHGDGAFPLYVGHRGGRFAGQLTPHRELRPQAQIYWVWGARKEHASELGTFAAQEIRKELRRNG